MKLALASILLGALVAPAAAHVTIASGPASSTGSSVVTFTIGHGCHGAAAGDPDVDTYALTLHMAANVKSVKLVSSTLGKVTNVVRNGAGDITDITFSKSDLAEVHASDDTFYSVTLRLAAPAAPFAIAYFTADQTCKTSDGTTLPVVHWDAYPGHAGSEDAPALTILPPRVPGWNKFVIPDGTHIADGDFAAIFKDAHIVWKGTAAFTANESIKPLIATTPGVTALTGGIHPGDTIWVRY